MSYSRRTSLPLISLVRYSFDCFPKYPTVFLPLFLVSGASTPISLILTHFSLPSSAQNVSPSTTLVTFMNSKMATSFPVDLHELTRITNNIMCKVLFIFQGLKSELQAFHSKTKTCILQKENEYCNITAEPCLPLW